MQQIKKIPGAPPVINAVCFQENPSANQMRSQMIKNQIRINECAQGPLEETFFSDRNIQLINKNLINIVLKKTNGLYRIAEQSSQSLTIVMRYIFIEYARFLPYDIPGQIKELNDRVLDEILPGVISNAEQKIGYLKDIENPLRVIALPMNTSNNSKDIPSVTTILFNR